MNTWYERNREKALETAKQWRLAHPERFKASQKAYKARKRAETIIVKQLNTRRPACQALSEGDFEEFYIKQGGKCLFCAKSRSRKMLAPQFNQTTDKIRGLVCRTCWIKVGLIEGYLGNPNLRARFSEFLLFGN